MITTKTNSSSPKVIMERTFYVCGSFALATAAQQFFKIKIPWKPHLTFSLVQGGITPLLMEVGRTFYLSQRDPQKIQWLGILYFALFFSVPAFMGRSIASWCFERLSYKEMAKCALFNWVGLGIPLVGYGAYRVRQKKSLGF